MTSPREPYPLRSSTSGSKLETRNWKLETYQSSPAIVLRRIDFSETSQVLHLYTREAGKVHAIAKGARRRRSSFQGPFDLFTLYTILRIERHAGTLDVLTAADVVRSFPNLSSHYDRFVVASYTCDLIDSMTLEAQRQSDLFDLLMCTWESLEAGHEPLPLIFRFEARLLTILGHFPRLTECGLCRNPIGGREAFFSCRDGGVVCTRCQPRDPRRLLVPCEIFGALTRYANPSAEVRLNPAWIAPLRRVLSDYVRHVIEGEPRSLRFIQDLASRTSAVLTHLSPSPGR